LTAARNLFSINVETRVAGPREPGGASTVLNGKRIFVVMPAYNAARTLAQTVAELPREMVDEVLVVDDHSSDATVQLARELGLTTFVHKQNLGYGRNQKTCYREALRRGADIVVMLHPDYQYSPRLVTAMASLIAYGEYDVVLGSRILGRGAMSGGMPFYKYVSNRLLTLFQNLLLNYKLSEYHTGYRAFSREVLLALPLEENSDDFVFDNEVLAQLIYLRYRIGEVSCPAKYFPEASSINFSRSVKYGFGVMATSLKFRLQKMGLGRFRFLSPTGRRLLEDYYHQAANTGALVH
jgi:glycosyltransferase involved in cell wall biosynthesis